MIQQQIRRQQRKLTSPGIFARLHKRGRLFWSRGVRDNASLQEAPNMTSAGERWADGDGASYAPKKPGARREKLAGYLRAANGLRQTYQQSYGQSWGSNKDGQDDNPMPGAFPGATVTRSGEEELVVFPSYARRHVKMKPQAVPGTIQESPGYGRDSRDTTGAGDAEYWKQQWEEYQDDNSIVDVDIRGWMFTPHKGPLTRKNRLFVGLARQMVGLPAPTGKSPTSSSTSSRATSPTGLRERVVRHAAKHDDEFVTRQAESIMQKGEAEAEVAGQGGYSENPLADSETEQSSSANNSRGPSHDRRGRRPQHLTVESLTPYDEQDISPLQKRASWNTVADMSPAEIAVANSNLMTRLQPFLANPVINTPISAFFYNDQFSTQKTIETNTAGHFSIRASLEFVPTHVRILASDRLSVTESIQITEPNGVSIISDIDDTIKHSAINSGAREIFRNVFIRDDADLSIEGVKSWYQKLSKLGVMFHYVSNSPWQLYPVLTGFFAKASLPSGSFHLKQYTGMFQGIFEPVAERKKSTLEKILSDFPQRRFILVGDSGEADLEVYTDVVLEHPGRVLGIFIRDITTSTKHSFFDSAAGRLNGERGLTNQTDGKRRAGVDIHRKESQEEDPHVKEAIARSLRDMESLNLDNKSRGNPRDETSDHPLSRPQLPPRLPSDPAASEEDLIDLSDDSPALPPIKTNGLTPSLTVPRRPIKPRRLSGNAISQPPTDPRSPPRPLKPSTSVHVPTKGDQNPKTAPPPPRLTYPAAARERITSAYNSIPSASTYLYGEPSADPNAPVEKRPLPPLPPRKPVANETERKPLPRYYANPNESPASSQAGRADSSDDGLAYGTVADAVPSNRAQAMAPNYGNKKEELWKRRWTRAKRILDDKGVMLRSWRVGSDVSAESCALVESAKGR